MESSENNAWVFDSLVGFLHGPVWNIPLQTFIEEKSLQSIHILAVPRDFTHVAPSLIKGLAFEPTENGDVLDRAEYKKIHNEYRNLVDVMLGSFMDDIGITADQFEAACRLSATDLAGLPAYFHKRLFEQIWAANDYDMFVKMMTHKNVELQLQALELIEKRFGAMPNLFSPETEDLDSSQSDESFGWPDNDDVMTEIKKLQFDDFPVKDEIVTVAPEEVVAEKQTLLSKLQHIEQKDEKIVVKLNNLQIKEDPIVLPKKVVVSDEEIQARQEYLKQQRDKLLALKKQVREKRLDAAQNEIEVGGGEGSRQYAPRPKSARAAQAVLSGTAPPPLPDAMQLRRALASKLKSEVVDIKQ